MSTDLSGGQERDSADLARFGYSQELKRSLGLFSSFAVAFSYISPSTGIFTLFALGLTTLGGVFIWTWPVVALGQFIVALNFAEVSSHYPVAGSVFQWTKYLANRSYSWFTGWIYLFAGMLTVTAVVATLPLALIPALNGLGWHSLNAASLHPACGGADHAGRHYRAEHLRRQAGLDHQQHRRGVRDPRHVRVRAGANGVPQPPGFPRRDQQRGLPRQRQHVPGRDVHEPVRDLRLRHRLDAVRGEP